jgi:hypothetical protein
VFFPGSASSPQALDVGMRSALAESLAYIHSAAARQVDLADLDVARGLSEIRAHRVVPGVFGRYYDLVFAVQSQRYDLAGTLFREILDLASERPIFSVLPLNADALGDDEQRYVRLLSLERDSSVALTAPDPNEWPGFEERVVVSLNLIENADAALASELRAVITQVVGAIPNPQNCDRGFGGASSFMLWGAVLLNVRLYNTRLDMLAVLVHEAAHQLLFCYSSREPLTENSVEERYKSPLRPDARPMDGIFHATFVCARMHYAYDRVMQRSQNILSRAELDLMVQRLHTYRMKFFDGFETVQRFGRMTATGYHILGAAADYMQSVN